MRKSTLELLKEVCLLGFGCTLLGVCSCNSTTALAQENDPLPAVKKCAHRGIPTANIINANQFEREE